MSVLLVVPPFHPLDRPAIGVSLLKAALAREGVPCEVLYLNVRFAELVGRSWYARIGEDDLSYMGLIGEWLFAADLFGDRAPEPEAYLEQILRPHADDDLIVRLSELRPRVPALLDDALADVDWGRYAVVGATSTFQQNCGALSVLRRAKERAPTIATAMGGANCEGAMGAAIHELFPFVDYVCSGEGDRVFPRLVRKLLAGEPVMDLPGLFVRGGLNVLGADTRAPLIRDLDALPYPDYDDYFAQVRASTIGSQIRPEVPMETSRGCWWGEKHHCTFCGMSDEGFPYRSKSAERALAELDFLLERYDVRKITAVDLILDLRYCQTFLKELASRPLPPRLFYETKANLTRDQLRVMARAGVEVIQPGVESLSTPILRLMNKGVTALQNVRLLKWCAELGIKPMWSLLCGFPGEDPAEYARMAELVPSLIHLDPPGGPEVIRLDRFSPNFEQSAERGFVNVRPLRPYRHVYPFSEEEIGRLVPWFEFDYTDGRDPERYAAPLREAADAWRTSHDSARLEMRLTDDEITIEDTRPAATERSYVLRGSARLAYLALDAGNTVAGVVAELRRTLGDRAPAGEEVERWFAEWLSARLVMYEAPRFISLATNPDARVRLPLNQLLDLLTSARAARAGTA